MLKTDSYLMLNFPSRFLISILLPGIEDFLKLKFNSSSFAFSSLSRHENQFFNYIFLKGIQLQTDNKIFNLEIFCEDFAENIKNKTIDYISDNLHFSNVILNFILKKFFKIDLIEKTDISPCIEKVRIDISFITDEKNLFLTVLIPIDFLKFFLNEKKEPTLDTIEKDIVNFFKNPNNFFPDIKSILITLSKIEIQNLFYMLQKTSLLTPYQISLLLFSFPQFTPLIMDNLSSNIVKEVNNVIKSLEKNKRDITGGIYSIEEAVYFSMKRNDKFYFSKFISQIQKWLRFFFNSQALVKNTFYRWMEEMDSSGLLYNTLSNTAENDIIKSISDNSDNYFKILVKYLPEKRIQYIYSLVNEKTFSLFEQLEAQSIFISNYKNLKIKKMNLGYESFPALLSKMSEYEMNYLLFRSGWFTLSTAFKNMNKKKIVQLIDKLPLGAKYLIIDVLEGIINPNIIHDEMQVNKARSACVHDLMSLFEDGIIDLK